MGTLSGQVWEWGHYMPFSRASPFTSLSSVSLLAKECFCLSSFLFFFFFSFFFIGIHPYSFLSAPQWEASDAEIKVTSGEKTELKRSLFKAWSRSAYSHTSYAYCQGFLSCLFLPFSPFTCKSFQILSRFLLCWLWLTNGSCVGPQNKIDPLAGCGFRVECPRNINRLKKHDLWYTDL